MHRSARTRWPPPQQPPRTLAGPQEATRRNGRIFSEGCSDEHAMPASVIKAGPGRKCRLQEAPGQLGQEVTRKSKTNCPWLRRWSPMESRLHHQRGQCTSRMNEGRATRRIHGGRRRRKGRLKPFDCWEEVVSYQDSKTRLLLMIRADCTMKAAHHLARKPRNPKFYRKMVCKDVSFRDRESKVPSPPVVRRRGANH